MNDLLAASVWVFFAVVLVAISRRRRSDRLELWILAVGVLVIAGSIGIPTLSHTITVAVTIGGAIIIGIGVLYGVFYNKTPQTSA